MKPIGAPIRQARKIGGRAYARTHRAGSNVITASMEACDHPCTHFNVLNLARTSAPAITSTDLVFTYATIGVRGEPEGADVLAVERDA